MAGLNLSSPGDEHTKSVHNVSSKETGSSKNGSSVTTQRRPEWLHVSRYTIMDSNPGHKSYLPPWTRIIGRPVLVMEMS